jgi:hypothetical protein
LKETRVGRLRLNLAPRLPRQAGDGQRRQGGADGADGQGCEGTGQMGQSSRCNLRPRYPPPSYRPSPSSDSGQDLHQTGEGRRQRPFIHAFDCMQQAAVNPLEKEKKSARVLQSRLAWEGRTRVTMIWPSLHREITPGLWLSDECKRFEQRKRRSVLINGYELAVLGEKESGSLEVDTNLYRRAERQVARSKDCELLVGGRRRGESF